MAQEIHTATPHDLTLKIRNERFGRTPGNGRWRVDGDPIATSWLLALSSTFPRGEAFFIESIKAMRSNLPARLAAEVRAFIKQEANHTREHVAFNRAAQDAGYDLCAIDARVEQLLADARKCPAIANLATTMALEHFTAMLGHELLTRPSLLNGADPQTAGLWKWHAVEEIEHKGVAYDVWLHATKEWSRWKRWKVKSLVMLWVTRSFVKNRIIDTLELLEQDRLTGARVKWRLAAHLLWKPGLLRHIFPHWIAYFMPGFHPWNRDDRHLIAKADSQYADARQAVKMPHAG